MTRNSAIPSTDLDGAKVFLDLASGDYLRLAGTAQDVWERIEHPTRVGSLVSDLSANYSIDARICQDDLLPFLEELVQAGLAVVEGAA